ncbi:MAG: M24 family metallopeptidase, partial [candidate division NC10 bacterium]
MDLTPVQSAIREAGLDGWLFCDFHNRDALAYRILGLDIATFTSRRWFYLVPATGAPVRLVSRVESSRLDALPGEKRLYLSWGDLAEALRALVGGGRVAMQWSPDDAIPSVSTVDAGLVDLVRAAGATVVSSADLVQAFEAVIDEAGYRSHMDAGRRVHAIKDEAFARIHDALESGRDLTEYDVQQFIVQRFDEAGLACDGEWPIVGVNDHPADPHFQPTPENARVLRRGDTFLIDLWARDKAPGSIWHDITWCGFAGTEPPVEYVRIFNVVRDARDAAVAFARQRFEAGLPCAGWEVDDACRAVVRAAGYGDFFIHRTGHSIGTTVHGNSVNIDNLETRDLRRLAPGVCFSVEPGIYLPGRMAVRSEIDVFVTHDGRVEVTGPGPVRRLGASFN